MNGPAEMSPAVFVRRIDTPPGAPWDQTRAARLNALHGAPLGTDDLVFDLQRIAPWSPRAPGEFAVAYLHRSMVTDRPVTASVGGVARQFRFRTPEATARRARDASVTAALVAGAAAAAVLAGFQAISAREMKSELLNRAEVNAAQIRRTARKAEIARADLALLNRAAADERGLAGLEEDLQWLGRAKAPSVEVQRVQWTPAAMQVVSQGSGQPVLGLERRVVWLGSVAGNGVWRIERGALPVIRDGQRRPSTVEAVPSRPSTR